MRLYLDTNILVYLVAGYDENLDPDTKQAIADKATLVSTDRQFPFYVEHGLKFHQNFR